MIILIDASPRSATAILPFRTQSAHFKLGKPIPWTMGQISKKTMAKKSFQLSLCQILDLHFRAIFIVWSRSLLNLSMRWWKRSLAIKPESLSSTMELLSRTLLQLAHRCKNIRTTSSQLDRTLMQREGSYAILTLYLTCSWVHITRTCPLSFCFGSLPIMYSSEYSQNELSLKDKLTKYLWGFWRF